MSHFGVEDGVVVAVLRLDSQSLQKYNALVLPCQNTAGREREHRYQSAPPPTHSIVRLPGTTPIPQPKHSVPGCTFRWTKVSQCPRVEACAQTLTGRCPPRPGAPPHLERLLQIHHQGCRCLADHRLHQRPTLINQRPTFISQRPTFINQRPTLISQRPTLINQRPAPS